MIGEMDEHQVTYNLPMDAKTPSVTKTYFGLIALVTGIISILFLGANYTVSSLDITPRTFRQLNNLTALFFCILTPLTFVLGVLGHTRKNDSKTLSWVAIALAVIPFLIIFARLVIFLVNGANNG